MTREGEAGAIHHVKPKEMNALKRHKNGLRKPLTLPLAHCVSASARFAPFSTANSRLWRDVLCQERTY